MSETPAVLRDGTTGQISLGPATRKLSPGEAGFRVGGGIPGLSCADCRYFVDNECFIVDVVLAPGDYCDEFTPALEKGNIPSPSGQTLTALSRTALSRATRMPTALYITRVAQDKRTGRRTWFATSSGTKVDAYGERMSLDLFQDFIRRIHDRETVPSVFGSEAWNGGNPYLGIAHYLDLGGYGIVGDAEKVYIDSSVLKARGGFRETPLSVAAFDAIRRDIEEDVTPENRVRISIAFIDWGHDHVGNGTFERKSLTDQCEMCDQGLGGKVYKRGHLVHLALTRRPAYPETEILLEERSMQTKRDDAASIVGETEAEELEKRAKTLTQRAGAGLVVKDKAAVEAPQPEPPTEPSGEPPAEPTEAAYLGGATTLAEAEAFVARIQPPPLMSAWGILAAVMANIASSKIVENKPLAIRSVISDFQSSLDVQQATIIQKIAPMLAQKGVALMGDTPETTVEPVVRQDETPPAEPAGPPPEETAAPEEEPKPEMQHPLGEALMAFRAAFDAAMATPVSPDERLVMIQPALDNLAEFIIRVVAGAPAAAAPQPENAPAPGPAGAGLMAAASLNGEDLDIRIDLRMAQHIAPVRAAIAEMQQAVQQIAANLGSNKPQDITTAQTLRVHAPVERPRPRAVRLVPRTLTNVQQLSAPASIVGVPQPPKRMSNLTREIRRSVGIVDSLES